MFHRRSLDSAVGSIKLVIMCEWIFCEYTCNKIMHLLWLRAQWTVTILSNVENEPCKMINGFGRHVENMYSLSDISNLVCIVMWWEYKQQQPWNSVDITTCYAVTHSIIHVNSCHRVAPVGRILRNLEAHHVFRCDQAALRTPLSVCPSVYICLSVTQFSLCSCHRIIMKFSGVITIDKSDVHTKSQGQRSKVKVTEVKTEFSRFRTETPVGIHVWLRNEAQSLK